MDFLLTWETLKKLFQEQLKLQDSFKDRKYLFNYSKIIQNVQILKKHYKKGYLYILAPPMHGGLYRNLHA